MKASGTTAAASLVIPTYNRKSELRDLLLSAQKQTAIQEIIVMDDGSSDGTVEMMSSEFPYVAFYRQGVSKGPAYLRNQGIEKASCNIVVSLDDDAVFVLPSTVEQTLAEFDHPRVGAVAIPYVNIRQDTVVRQRTPNPAGVFVTHAFVGAAHAVRRDVFLKLGGYRERLFYMGEEGDYCLRMLDAGFVTRLGMANHVHHLESSKRKTVMPDYLGRRNDVIFTWQNVPTPYLPLHVGATVLGGTVYAIRSARHPLKMFSGMFSGLAECLRGNFERKPVDSGIYRLNRELKKRGPLPLRNVIDRLPPLSAN